MVCYCIFHEEPILHGKKLFDTFLWISMDLLAYISQKNKSSKYTYLFGVTAPNAF